MLNANDARKEAEEFKSKTEEVTHLLNHFEQLIKRASNQGKFEIEKISFAADRFKPTNIDNVVQQLKDVGFKVQTTKNNALNQINFNITW